MSKASPRHRPTRGALPGAGLPDARLGRTAARNAFVSLKQTYLMAIEPLPAPRAEWLRFQIRHAAEPADLWQLRASVFDALPQRFRPAFRPAPAAHRSA